MKKFLLLLHFTFCVFYFAVGQQAPGIEWQNTIGGSGGDELRSIRQTIDGGYIVGGWSESDISGDKTENNWDTTCGSPFCTADYWIVKLDSIGNIQWQNTIGGDNDDQLYSLELTADGGYILGGISASSISGDKTENSNGGGDYWIVKLDSSGNIQWQNTIGGNSYEFSCSVKQTSDSGYFIYGISSSDISGDKTENNIGPGSLPDYWVVKTDSTGNILWQNTIGGSYSEENIDAQETTDGGYILGGISYSNYSGDKSENTNGFADYWIVKLDSSGNIQWQNTIGGVDYDEPYSIYQLSDGGYLVAGRSDSDISGDKTDGSNGFYDYWIIRLSSNGAIQWQNSIGGFYTDKLYCMQPTSDAGFILGGMSNSYISGDKTENCIGNYDYWIVKTDSIGSILWDNTIGGTEGDFLYSFQTTNDGGYILGGFSDSNISVDKTENSIGGRDYWIVKLYPDTITSITNTTSPTSGIQIFPNPITNELTINLNYPNYHNTPITISVTDIMGKQIFTTSITTSNHKLQTSNLAKGIYFLKLNVDGNVVTKKVVKM